MFKRRLANTSHDNVRAPCWRGGGGRVAVCAVPVQLDGHLSSVVGDLPGGRLVTQLERVHCLADDARDTRERCQIENTPSNMQPKTICSTI